MDLQILCQFSLTTSQIENLGIIDVHQSNQRFQNGLGDIVDIKGYIVKEVGYGHGDRAFNRLIRIPTSISGPVYLLFPLLESTSPAGLLGHRRAFYDEFK